MLGVAQCLHTTLSLFGVEPACDHLHPDSFEFSVQLLLQIVRGGNVAAEHHRIETTFQEWLEVFNQKTELGMAFLTQQSFGLSQQGTHSRIASVRSWSDIILDQIIFGTIKQLGRDSV